MQRHKRNIIGVTLIACLLCLFGTGAGCKTALEPGGAYAPTNELGQATQAPDPVLYNADLSFQVAYNSLDFIFLFEKQNRTALDTVSPDIHKTVDSIRPLAVKARDEYIAARKVYRLNPVPANAEGLDAALLKVEQLLATARTALARNQPQPQTQAQ